VSRSAGGGFGVSDQWALGRIPDLLIPAASQWDSQIVPGFQAIFVEFCGKQLMFLGRTIADSFRVPIVTAVARKRKSPACNFGYKKEHSRFSVR
jgi:hypothetical protein